MITKFKELVRGKFSPRTLLPGDRLVLSFRGMDGKEETLVKHSIDVDQAMTVDEGVLFESEFEDRRALGALALERKGK
jgi:hypothetical protein